MIIKKKRAIRITNYDYTDRVTPIYTKSQDIPFTQFYNAALRMNTALTGNFDGKFRFNLNCKGQWENVRKPFKVFADSFDQNVMKN